MIGIFAIGFYASSPPGILCDVEDGGVYVGISQYGGFTGFSFAYLGY